MVRRSGIWVVLLTLALLMAGTATASAQGTAGAAGQAPRFPFLGPSSAPQESEGPPRATSPLPPDRTARCRWDLRGSWESRGRQTEPNPNTYTARLAVRQYGNYVVVEQPDDNLRYYGVCSGDRVELDAYSGDSFVGAQTGTVSANGRRIETTWVLFSPGYAAGYETLNATGTPSR